MMLGDLNCVFNCFRDKASIELGSHIVMKGEKTGFIRYLGHLDGVGQPKVVFAGVELDAPGMEIITCVKT